MLFGMLDRNEVYALPFHELEQFKQKMDATESEGRDKYWHVRIAQIYFVTQIVISDNLFGAATQNNSAIISPSIV
jgi:hypothetical protein